MHIKLSNTLPHVKSCLAQMHAHIYTQSKIECKVEAKYKQATWTHDLYPTPHLMWNPVLYMHIYTQSKIECKGQKQNRMQRAEAKYKWATWTHDLSETNCPKSLSCSKYSLTIYIKLSNTNHTWKPYRELPHQSGH